MRSNMHDGSTVDNDKIDVLLVDDRIDCIIAMQSVLGNIGLNLVTALSGEEAIQLLPQHDFAVIVMDVQMPKLDGFQTTVLIKQKPEFAHIPIIFVTALNKDEKYIFEGYESGAVDYIFKPFEPYILKSKVMIFADLHQKSKKIREQDAKLYVSEQRDQFRHLAELELENLRRYRNLADAIPHAVFKAKADGTMDYVNGSWHDYTGLSVDQSVGSGWQKAFPPDDLQKVLKCWTDAMLTGKGFECEVRLHSSKHVEPRWNLVRGIPETKGSEILGWLGTITDIHDRRETSLQLEEAKRAAEMSNEAKTYFLANMSHEIRTPLSAILGYTELLANPEQNFAERMQGIATIRRNGELLLAIIDEILDISKIEAGRFSVEILSVDIETLFWEVGSLLRLKAEEKGVLLNLSCATQIPKYIKTDPTRLRQILMNVIGNAVKFTDRGAIDVVLAYQASIESQQDVLGISICDTGAGISVDQASRLFQPFTQGDNSTKRRFGGTGLGLALSRRIARALGGDVQIAQTSLGEGSTFEIKIACDRIEDAPLLDAGQLNSREAESLMPSLPQLPNLDGIEVLLVEDSVDNQNLISYFLRQSGAKIDLAGNGKEGLAFARKRIYNVILMDIQMPIMDGYEATECLRREGYGHPIIALTAHALKDERERCLRLGFNDHFTKPVDRKKLIEKISVYRNFASLACNH